jgi:hypothetical protein
MKKIFVVLLVMAILFSCFGCQLGAKKDESKAKFEFEADLLMDAEVRGYNGHGLLALSVNPEKLAELTEEIEDELDDAEADYDEDRLANLIQSLSFVCENNSNLSNGDVLTIRTSYDANTAEKLDISFTPEDFTYTVSGLITAEEIDPFENLEVTYTGVAPEGVVNINSNKCTNFVQNNVSFSIEGDEGNIYSNGDEVTIVASFGRNYIEDPKAPVVLSVLEKQYTVSGLDIYPSDLSKLDLTAVMSDMYDSANTYVIDRVYYIITFNDNDYWASDPEITGLFITPHEMVYLQPKNNSGKLNNLIIVYKVTYTAEINSKLENVETYIAVEYVGFATDEAMTEIKYAGEINVSRQSMDIGTPEEYASFYNKAIGVHTETHIIQTLALPNAPAVTTATEATP